METVNTINLLSRDDRLLSIAKQAKEQKFALRIWPGITNDDQMPPYKNINKAFRLIVQDAKDNGYEYTIIMEDDCYFHSHESFKYYIDNKPSDFDLYLGMVYSAEVEVNNRILNGYSGHTLLMVHSRFYDTWLSMPEDAHCDRWCGGWAYVYKYFVCYPYVCKQLNGYSDNKRGIYSYDTYLEGKEFI